jgi:WD40 repeat protein
LAFSARGERLAGISPKGGIRVWTVPDWKELPKIQVEADWVLFARDGETLLSGAANAEITQWRTATGERVGIFSPDSAGEPRASISPDGRFLATATGDTDRVRLWDVATRHEIARFKGGADSVISVAFSADGKTVAAGTFDGVIQLWNVASGQQAGILQGHITFVNSLAFSPDGSALVSGGMDNTLRLWKAANLEKASRIEQTTR